VPTIFLELDKFSNIERQTTVSIVHIWIMIRLKADESQEKGSIRWAIPAWSSLPSAKGVGTSSPEFSCAGHHWSILVIPGGEFDVLGDSDATKSFKDDNVAVYLLRKGSDKGNLKVKFTLRILNIKSNADSIEFTDTRIFSTMPPSSLCMERSHGFFGMIPKVKIQNEALGFKENDCVFIDAEIITSNYHHDAVDTTSILI
jgi:hypothetical protein